MILRVEGRVRLLRGAKVRQNRRLPLGATLETFIKQDDEQTDQRNNAENDKGGSPRVHFDTSLPSRKWPIKPNSNPIAMPRRSPDELKLSGFANGPMTRRVKATFAMSQKNFARLSFCFSARMILIPGFPKGHVNTLRQWRQLKFLARSFWLPWLGNLKPLLSEGEVSKI